VELVHKLLFEQADDDIASTKGEGAEVQGGKEELKKSSVSFFRFCVHEFLSEPVFPRAEKCEKWRERAYIGETVADSNAFRHELFCAHYSR
jgi:hypothetical protein